MLCRNTPHQSGAALAEHARWAASGQLQRQGSLQGASQILAAFNRGHPNRCGMPSIPLHTSMTVPSFLFPFDRSAFSFCFYAIEVPGTPCFVGSISAGSFCSNAPCIRSIQSRACCAWFALPQSIRIRQESFASGLLGFPGRILLCWRKHAATCHATSYRVMPYLSEFCRYQSTRHCSS